MTKTVPIQIQWHDGMPIFASESFLASVGNEYGWLGGVDDAGHLHCVLPYTIVRKWGFRMVRFRVETIPMDGDVSVEEERSFLNGVVAHFKSTGADIIIPATTSTIFRTYPKGADVAPYGTYIIDLRQSEETIWRNIDRITRQNINSAQKDGITVVSGNEYLDGAYALICDTFKRSGLPFMSCKALKRFMTGLGQNGRLMVADYQGAAQSYVIFAFSRCCAYAIYAGNLANQRPGANKLLYWEAIKSFRQMGIPRYDFVGARINPEKGSKQAAINSFKKRFGAELVEGYMWKYSLRPTRALVYTLAVRWLRGGDIVDRERHKFAE